MGYLLFSTNHSHGEIKLGHAYLLNFYYQNAHGLLEKKCVKLVILNREHGMGKKELFILFLSNEVLPNFACIKRMQM